MTDNPEDLAKLQVYPVQEMVKAYYELYCANTFKKFVDKVAEESVKTIFTKVFELYMLTKICADEAYYSRILSEDQVDNLQVSVVNICGDLRKDAIALTDILPIPNRVLGPLGNEDLQVYSRF
jgi:hypothetical protein